SAGVDHLLARGSFPPGIVLTNARGAYGRAIAQYTLGAILRVAEQVDARTALQQRGTWPAGEDDFVGRRLAGRTLVILGYGGIGREIARVARVFGMRVIAVKARPEERIDRSYRPAGTGDPDGTLPERIVGLVGLREAVAEADYFSVTLPGGPGSRAVVDAGVLAALPAHAWIVSTGRGTVIDEAALIRTLEAGAIGGAVLDVFETEPLPSDSPLWRLPNVHITPHVAGGGAGPEIAGLLIENLRRFGAGEPLLNQVDLQRGY
ncbi:MAG TPA: D-2-hydroxyacid dehydrogenase, partial [Candidatus Limnocylindrales bacterium]|nr:D-2-hydroxyacid dehydrogenase [Candidatus Limnocylindrales bacterium]